MMNIEGARDKDCHYVLHKERAGHHKTLYHIFDFHHRYVYKYKGYSMFRIL